MPVECCVVLQERVCNSGRVQPYCSFSYCIRGSAEIRLCHVHVFTDGLEMG